MIYAVIMAGGEGKRFWPLSRRNKPKQFLQIISNNTLLEETVKRLKGLVPNENVYVITGKDHVKGVHKLLPKIPKKNIIGEPFPRDTAPCVGLAASIIQKRDKDGIMITLPADHAIKPDKKFRETLSAAASLAEEDGVIVTVGIKAERPATGYGYIHRGKSLGKKSGLACFKVRRFKEKPPLHIAEKYVKSGEYYWNGGIFVWKASTILDSFRQFRPDMFKAFSTLQPKLGTQQQDRAIEKTYAKLEKISVDYAIMEHAKNIKVIEAGFDWDDVGSWSALFRHHRLDENGNLFIAPEAVTIDVHNCLIYHKKDKKRGKKKIVAAAGITDIIVIDTPDVLFVCHKDNDQDTKKLVDKIRTGYY